MTAADDHTEIPECRRFCRRSLAAQTPPTIGYGWAQFLPNAQRLQRFLCNINVIVLLGQQPQHWLGRCTQPVCASFPNGGQATGLDQHQNHRRNGNCACRRAKKSPPRQAHTIHILRCMYAACTGSTLAVVVVMGLLAKIAGSTSRLGQCR